MTDTPTAADRLFDLVADHIRRYDFTTCAEIARISREAGIPEEGTIAVFLAENCCLWAGCSDELAIVLERLIAPGSGFRMEGTTPLCYLLDGQSLRLPVARSIRAYKKLRWLPGTFRPVLDPAGLTG